MNPAHYQKLAAAGLNVEQIGVVMQILAESEAASKAAEEARKAGARERVQRWRDKQKEAVTLPKHNGNATVPLTRVEITSSKEEVSGKEKKERSPQKATRLPADWTLPEHWLQEAIDAGMSREQGAASAARMHNWSLSDQKGVKLDWHATWRNWFARDLPKPNSTASPARQKPKTQATMWHDEARAHGILPDVTPSPTNGRMVARLPAGPNQGPGLTRQFAGPRDG